MTVDDLRPVTLPMPGLARIDERVPGIDRGIADDSYAPREQLHPRTSRARVSQLRALKEQIQVGPAVRRTSDRPQRRTARERIALFLDENSFVELEPLRRSRFGEEQRRPHTDGVVTGWGTVEGRRVFLYAQDWRFFGGSLGEAHAAKIHRVMDLAISTGAPLVGLNDGAGARIQEGVTALAGYGGIFRRHSLASGVIPQISIMLGPCAGGAAYSPALTDFVFMVRETAQMFITGPDVIRSVTGEEVSREELGGADVHAERSGVAHFVFDDEESCLKEVRFLLTLLPANNLELPPTVPTDDPAERSVSTLLDLVPAQARIPYDLRSVIEEIVDDGEFLEVHARWSTNVVVGLARLDGEVVGIVANQPAVLAGVLDVHSSEKAARFVQTCDAFNVPLVTLVDVPGFLPGADQEHAGIIRHGAKLLYAYCTASVPRIQVILRKAFGGAYIVMDSRSIGADVSLAWPTNEIAVMGAEGAADIIHRRSIAESDDPAATRARLVSEYEETLMHPYRAAEQGLIDDVIDPAQTRSVLIKTLDMLRSKRVEQPIRKHGNPPV